MGFKLGSNRCDQGGVYNVQGSKKRFCTVSFGDYGRLKLLTVHTLAFHKSHTTVPIMHYAGYTT